MIKQKLPCILYFFLAAGHRTCPAPASMPPGLPGGKLSQKYCAKPVDGKFGCRTRFRMKTHRPQRQPGNKNNFPKLIKILKKIYAQLCTYMHKFRWFSLHLLVQRSWHGPIILDRSHREVLQVFQTAALRKAKFWVLLDLVTPMQLEMHIISPGTSYQLSGWRSQLSVEVSSIAGIAHHVSPHVVLQNRWPVHSYAQWWAPRPSKTGIQKGYQVDPKIRPQEYRRDAVVVETDGMPKDRMSRGLRPAREAIFQLSHRGSMQNLTNYIWHKKQTSI